MGVGQPQRDLHLGDHRKEQMHRKRRDQRGQAEGDDEGPAGRPLRLMHQANCGNSRSALPRSMAARCGGAMASSASEVFIAAAVTAALANGESVPNTICSGAATFSRQPQVCSPGDSALSYQKRRKSPTTCSCEICLTRLAIIGDTDSRQEKYGTRPPACGRMKRMRG